MARYIWAVENFVDGLAKGDLNCFSRFTAECEFLFVVRCCNGY